MFGSSTMSRMKLDWIGIGAQRSGTTWFTDLLAQHPEIRLPTSGKKELHQIYRGLLDPSWEDGYLDLFPREGMRGEFTPAYLRCTWLPETVKRLITEQAPVFVLLRDPIDRFTSAIRHNMRTDRARSPEARDFHQWVLSIATDVQFGGMYATQLRSWQRLLDDQLVVIQYEQMKLDPAGVLADAWHRIGLAEAAPLSEVEVPSDSSNESQFQFDVHGVAGLMDSLSELYAPEVRALTDQGLIDPSLWQSYP